MVYRQGGSLPVCQPECFCGKGYIFMNIQMNFDADCLEFILKNNLLEKIRPYLSLSEVLEWMADYPEVLACKKDAYLYTGNEGVSIVLRLHREEDTFTVTVYDVSIY